MSIIEHIILFSILFIVYAFWGKYNVNKSGAAFWLAAIIPILLYVFVVGSRWGWGVDWFWYKVQLENPLLGRNQIVFRWLNQFLNTIGFNYVGGFMVYAFIFITCAFVLLRSYGEESKYMYCLLVQATLFSSCHTIRQGLGLAFIFLAIVYLCKRKWLYMIIATLIAYNIHSATLVTLAAILGIFFILKKPIHYWLSILLYLFFVFVFDAGKMTFLADFLNNYIALDNGFQNYIDNSDAWFGEDAIKENFKQGVFASIMTSLFHIFLFYLGYIALKTRENKQVLLMYNTYVIGAIMVRATFFFEILRRLTHPMEMFYFIPLGYIFYVYFRDCKQPENHYAILLKKYFPVGITLILAYLFMYWGRWLLLNPEADFFWNRFYDYIDESKWIYLFM